MKRLVLALGVAALAFPALAGEVKVAVASNFTAVAEAIAAAFGAKNGNQVALSFGSSGALYAQISQGAPFEVLLSADAAKPKAAIDEGHAVEGTEFTYAMGTLVLYSPTLDLTSGLKVLNANAFSHLAIADPKTAPYGAAASFALAALGLKDKIADKLVVGENVGQALQFVESGNAELGFVAQSQVLGKDPARLWVLPKGLYQPIQQDAVLLNSGATDPAAAAFLDFLKSDEAKALISAGGYTLP